jgi:hypothetical protein
VTRKCFEASDSVDPSDRLICTHRPSCYRAECQFAVGLLQLAKCFCAVLKPDQCWLGWRSIYTDFFLPVKRLNCGSLVSGIWQSANFAGYQNRISHRLGAQPRSARIFRPVGHRPEFAFLARDLSQTRRVVERMQCPRESILLLLRFRRAAHVRHEFPRLAQRIAGLRY